MRGRQAARPRSVPGRAAAPPVASPSPPIGSAPPVPASDAITDAPSAFVGPGPIQAKLGFEVEMKVLLSKHTVPTSTDESAYGDASDHYQLGRKGAFDVVVDHANGITNYVATNGRPAHSTILEVRTDPVDEGLVSRKEAEEPMRQAAVFAADIEKATAGFKQRVPLTDVLPPAPNDLTIGWNRQPSDTDFMTTDADIQATFGLKVAEVPSMIGTLTAATSGVAGDVQPPVGHKDVLGMARTAARAAIREAYVGPALRKRLQELRDEKEKLDQADVKGRQDVQHKMVAATKTGTSEAAFEPFVELEGLVTLIATYLVAGQQQRDTGQLDKNLIPLLARHQLAELHAALSPATRGYLHDGVVRAALRDQILTQTKRGAGEFLFPTRPSRRTFGAHGAQDFADHNKCGEWVDRVLAGDVRPVTIAALQLTDDISSYFGKMKKIAPEEVGPQRGATARDRGAVLEQRMMTKAIPYARWTEVAGHYYDLLRERNAIQRKAGAAPAARGPIADGAGQPLAAPVRARAEDAFGADFAAVRVHEGAAAPALGAVAYTQGEHVHFAPGRYQPETAPGRELLGHELAHVVQQRAGRVTMPQGKGAPINADPALEAEADRAGAALAAGRRVDGADGAGSSTGFAAAERPVQRKVGFEIEVSILLSKGGPSSEPQAASDAPPVLTGKELMAFTPEDLESQYGERMVLAKALSGKLVALRWDPTAWKGTIKPEKVADHEQGRWVAIPNWTAGSTNNEHYFDPHLNKSDKVFAATPGVPFDVVEDHTAQPIAGKAELHPRIRHGSARGGHAVRRGRDRRPQALRRTGRARARHRGEDQERDLRLHEAHPRQPDLPGSAHRSLRRLQRRQQSERRRLDPGDLRRRPRRRAWVDEGARRRLRAAEGTQDP